MKKILFSATVDLHIKSFHLPYLKMMQEKGYETHVASNGGDKIDYCDVKYNLPFARNPFKTSNIAAYKQLKAIIKQNHFEIIHCHTPVGGVLTRLAAKAARKRGTRVIYTAHGFHFCQDAPLKDWLIYYPIEKICAQWTDTLITINKEDYQLAKNNMRAKYIEYIPGVGIDVDRFSNTVIDKTTKRTELGVPLASPLLVSVGELSRRKNHATIIKAISQIPHVNYIICGTGELKHYLQNCAEEYGVSHRVHLLGYRNDIAEIYQAADICCFPSIREGLPVALMEAMGGGLPCVASKIRGNTDLIEPDLSGYLCAPLDADAFSQAIKILIRDKDKAKSFGEYNKSIAREFSLSNALQQMEQVYGLGKERITQN